MSIPSPVVHNKNSEFYFEYLYVQVEEELFKLPRYKFEKESGVLRNLTPNPRGWIPEKPLLYHSFSKAEFLLFLAVFYPRGLSTPTGPPETIDSLGAALKVATAIQLFPTRQRIIETLRKKVNRDAVSVLDLAMKYWDAKLIQYASTSLVNRNNRMSDEEVELLGFEISFYISRAREDRKAGSTNWVTGLQTELARQRSKREITFLSPETPENPSNQPSASFYAKETIFLVGAELFNVARYSFLNDSETFSDMFSLPNTDTTAEGDSDTQPIDLSGICTKEDFVLLLQALYNLPSDGMRQKLPWTDLASLLKLSTMWHFKVIRDETIAQLQTLFSSNTELTAHQLALGQSEKVPSWITDGYYTLVTRPQSMTIEEGNLLSPATIVAIMQLRETAYSQVSCYNSYDYQRSYVTHYNRRELTKQEVEQKIAEELKAAVFV